jgi:hypothetical protein
VPPLIGRIFNITSDILEKATEELAKTFFISPGTKNKKFFSRFISYLNFSFS